MKLKYPIQISCKAGYLDALTKTGTRNTHRCNGIGLLVLWPLASNRVTLEMDSFRSNAMGKGQEKPNASNKPKLSVKDKKQKKKDKAAAGK